MAQRSRNPQMREALAKVQLPESYPPLARLLIGTDETMWLEFTTVAGERTWHMLDGRGTPIAQLKVPRNLRIMVATRSNVWAIETDGDDLQHPVRYGISR